MQNQNELVKFNPLKALVVNLAARCALIRVTDEASQKAASLVLSEARGLRKEIGEFRVSITKPHQDFVKEVQAQEKLICESLDAGERQVKSQLLAREQVLAKERAEAFKKAEDERKAKEQELREKAARDVTPPALEDDLDSLMSSDHEIEVKKVQQEVVKQAEIKQDTVTMEKEHKAAVAAAAANKVTGARKVWKCKVTALDAVPVEYVEPNLSKMMKDFHAGKVKEIPGVEFYQETSI